MPSVSSLDLHPYMLRHGGPSYDRAYTLRTLEEIQKRGRWKSANSVRRYEKGGRVAEQLHKVPRHLQAHAARCGQLVGQVAAGQCLVVALPHE